MTDKRWRYLRTYAGSPVLIKDYLRRDDSAIFNELNREDFYQLRKSFAGSDRFSLFNLFNSKQ